MSVFSVDSAAGDNNCVAASLDTTLPGRWKPTGVNYPWTVKAAPKPRKGTSRRAVFSDLQRQKLEDRFLLQKYISKPERKKLAESLGLKDSQVTIFFSTVTTINYRHRHPLTLLYALTSLISHNLRHVIKPSHYFIL